MEAKPIRQLCIQVTFVFYSFWSALHRTSGGLVQTEVMAVLPSIPAGLCLLVSLLACSPALLAVWRRPTAVVFAWGVVSEPCEVQTVAGENCTLWIACFVSVFCFFSYTLEYTTRHSEYMWVKWSIQHTRSAVVLSLIYSGIVGNLP